MSTEERAAALAELAVEESAALDRQRAARHRAELEAGAARAVAVTAVERPGDPPSAADRRAWALQEAIRRNPVVLRPGGGPEPVNVLYAVGGETQVVRNIPLPSFEVITPDRWEQHEARWQFRQRRAESELLVAAYGLDRCIKEGFITRSDVTVYELGEVTAAPELRGLEGM